VLQFFCPNGHKIHCPEDQAGRAAKCPKCGVAFKVPTLEQLAPDKPVTAGTASGIGRPLGEAASASGKSSAKKEPQIEFLCPNGHRLHGPASMQGHAGQCPECGSKFRIPNYDELTEDDEGDELDPQIKQELEEAVDDALDVVQHDLPAEATPSAEDTAVASLPHPVGLVDKASQSSLATAPRGPGASGERALAMPSSGWRDLFRELWAQKSAEVVVEVLLDDGEAITPECYADDEAGRHAQFAVKNSNGTYTLTVVGWDSVSRVMLRGLKSLPDRFRENDL
jgi:hypothetical protein